MPRQFVALYIVTISTFVTRFSAVALITHGTKRRKLVSRLSAQPSVCVIRDVCTRSAEIRHNLILNRITKSTISDRERVRNGFPSSLPRLNVKSTLDRIIRPLAHRLHQDFHFQRRASNISSRITRETRRSVICFNVATDQRSATTPRCFN